MKGTVFNLNNSIIAMLLIASLFGVMFYFFFMDFGMMMNSNGSMPRCPFSPDGSICTMTFQEHMSIWQNIFTATPQKVSIASLIMLSLWLSIATLVIKNLLLKYQKILSFSSRFYTKQFSYISLVDPSKRAIYRGRITPKIF